MISGIGTIEDPYDLATALASARPGQTYYLRGGTYTGSYSTTRSGKAGKPIVIRPYPGEQPIIDGSLTVSASHQHWYGIEIKNSGFTDRINGTNGKICLDHPVGNGCKFINMIIHDGRQGISCGVSATNTLFYGIVGYHCGWDSTLGHIFYPQNASGRKVIQNCILFDSFGYHIHIYGGAGSLDNFTVADCIIFNGGTLRDAVDYSPNIHIGGDTDPLVENPIMTGNRTYYSRIADTGQHTGVVRIGYGSNSTVTNAVIKDNFIVASEAQSPPAPPVQGVSLRLTDCVPAEMTGNSFYGSIDGFSANDYPLNTYGTTYNVPDTVFLHSNQYDINRAHLAIYNTQAQANAVTVDVSSLFSDGNTITARNVQDFWNDTQSLTVSGGNITINMQAINRSVATPQGWTVPKSTFPAFGCFVLERQ